MLVSVHLQLCMRVCVCNVPCVDVLYAAECTFELSKEYIFLSAVATKPELCGMQIYMVYIYGMHA